MNQEAAVKRTSEAADESISFEEKVLAGVNTDQEFKPTVFYNSDGDCIEWLFGPDSYYAERIDDLVTVFISRESGEPTGALIKNVAEFVGEILESAPGFKLECRGAGLKLEYLLTAGLWRRYEDDSKEESEAVKFYLRLRDVADVADTRVELNAC